MKYIAQFVHPAMGLLFQFRFEKETGDVLAYNVYYDDEQGILHEYKVTEDSPEFDKLMYSDAYVMFKQMIKETIVPSYE
jgi:hypothetical protein